MAKLRLILARLSGHFRKTHRERDMTEELAAHFQMHVDDNVRAGMSEREARREAALKFGSLDAAKEEMREMSTTLWVETTLRDVQYAVRGLRRSKGFALTAIFSLALGIGASLAIFSVADGLLLRPMPFRDPDRVVMVWERNVRRSGIDHNVISPGNYFDWKKQNTVFEGMASFGDGHSVVSASGRVEELGDRFATWELLPMLGVKPWRGRFFTAEEDTPTGPEVLVISYGMWQSWFGGNENAIGQTVQLRSQPATIIGVLPPGFYFRDRNVDVWEPMGLDAAKDYRASSGRYALAVARLRRGITLRRAQAQMTAIAQRLETAYPVFDKNWTVNVEPLRDSLVREVKSSLIVLLGAVGLLLAVACANVANLLLARCTTRKREIAVRMAIGAGRGRVVRQFLTESVLLSATGAALGLAFCRVAVTTLLALAPRDLARTAVVSVDMRVAGLALALSVLTGVLFGLAPALVAARDSMAQGLREGARSHIGGGRRLRSLLVAAEVALSLVLLSGAGLLFRTMVGLQRVDPGLDPKGLLTFRISLPGARYPAAGRIQFFTRLVDEMRRLPKVTNASAVSYLPFDGLAAGTDFEIAGRPKARPGESLGTSVRTVLPGYFRTMGLSFQSGRDFTPADNTADSPYRFIVSQTFASRYLPGENPLGKQISVDMGSSNPFGEIIGVVGDVKEGALDQKPAPTVYYVHAHLLYTQMILLVRTAGDPLALSGGARRAVHSLDAGLPLADVRTMDSIVAETFARQRFSALLLAAFSTVSLLLAAVGIYGVLAYSVTERTQEIGVRVALGAGPGRIAGLVIGGAAMVVLPGMAAGIGGSLALTGVLRSMLFGVEPHDAVTLVAATGVLALAALIAAYLPARRASKLTPLEALRA